MQNFALNPPLCRRYGTQPLPVYSGGEPTPLFRAHTIECFTRNGPSEPPLVQAAMAQPNARAVPDQELDTRMATVGKTIGRAIAWGAPVSLLDQR